jgi:hypothetical protein
MVEASSCTRGIFPRFGIEGKEFSDREREMLIEEATTAWRSRSPDGRTLEHHTLADLDAAARQTVFNERASARLGSRSAKIERRRSVSLPASERTTSEPLGGMPPADAQCVGSPPDAGGGAAEGIQARIHNRETSRLLRRSAAANFP